MNSHQTPRSVGGTYWSGGGTFLGGYWGSFYGSHAGWLAGLTTDHARRNGGWLVAFRPEFSRLQTFPNDQNSPVCLAFSFLWIAIQISNWWVAPLGVVIGGWHLWEWWWYFFEGVFPRWKGGWHLLDGAG